MRFKEYAVGKITKQNTTADVKPGEIKRQAAKFGNKIGKDGKPPTLGKKIKGPKTNVLYNLGMAESKCGEGEYFCRQSQKCKPIPPGHIVKKDGTLVKENKEIASTTEIFIDMDGVLADFFTEWGKLMGKKDWRDIGSENISKALEKIKQTENFWLDLPLTSNAKNLINLVKQVKGEYNILSSPLPGDPKSEPHKRQWIKKNLNFFPPKKIFIRHDKESFATQSDGTPNILIDDYGVNVRKWEASGGVGFKHKDHKFERTAKAIKQHMDEPVEEGKRIPRKKGQPAGSKKHSDLYTDENPKGTIHGLKFATVADAKASVSKIRNSGKKHAHKIQAAVAMEQRAKAAGKTSAAAVYRKYINAMKKKTKAKNENYTRDQLPQIKEKNLKNIQHTLEYVHVNKIIPVQKERIMDNFKKQVDKIVAGDYNPIVVDCDNKIINGHHRWSAAKLMGFEEMAVAKLPLKISTIVEKWSKKYKKSINCKNPKGFSQKAHCAGRKKR